MSYLAAVKTGEVRAVSPRPPRTYVFGPFRLDANRRLLLSGETFVPLSDRLFEILLTIVQAGGRLVEKEALTARVWPDQAVTDGNLAQHVYMLRQILGERAKDRSYILTVPGKGYRLAVAAVDASSSDADGANAEDAEALGALLLSSDLDVIRHYCRASRLLEARTAPSLKSAIDAYQAALRIDPDYAPALLGLARAFALLAEFWHVPARQAFEKAKIAALRALRLDESSAVAHAVLAEILLFGDWDWARAGEEIEIALRSNPSSPIVRNTAVWYHLCRGSLNKAMHQAQRALMLEPSSPYLHLLLARVLVHAQNFAQGIASLSALIEADPGFSLARRYRAQAHLLNGDPGNAIADLMLLPADRSEDPSFRLPMLGRAYADCGDRERAVRVHRALIDISSTEYVVAWNLAISAIGAGDEEAALGYLESAFAQREPAMLFLRSQRWFRPIESHPRFRRLLDAIS